MNKTFLLNGTYTLITLRIHFRPLIHSSNLFWSAWLDSILGPGPLISSPTVHYVCWLAWTSANRSESDTWTVLTLIMFSLIKFNMFEYSLMCSFSEHLVHLFLFRYQEHWIFLEHTISAEHKNWNRWPRCLV